MAAHPGPFDLEPILEHSAWVRRLAESLVRDPGDADDIAQQAVLIAARRTPEAQHGLKPWLAGVVTNLVRRARRDRDRRELHERRAARPESQPAADGPEVNAELRALVGRALAELDEPFRTTVILRYFAGLEPAEIAVREGVPAATVRTRLKRGLERLREGLDRRHGDRGAWSALVVSLVDADKIVPALTAPAGGGLILMSTTWKVAAGAAALAASVAVGWWMLDGEPPAPPASAHVAAGDGPVELVEPTAARDAAPPADAEERAALAAQSTGKAHTRRDLFDLYALLVRARLVDEAHAPLAGAELVQEKPPIVARADAQGQVEFRLPFPPPGDPDKVSCTLAARMAGRATQRVLADGRTRATVDLGDIVLPRACVLTGRVEDELGQPVPDARVLAGPAHLEHSSPETLRLAGPQYPEHRQWIPATRTRVDGRFELADAAPGSLRVWAQAAGFEWTSSEVLELRAGARASGIVLVLRPTGGQGTIAGVVLAPDGSPAGRTRVYAAFASNAGASTLYARADEHGAFRLALEAAVPHELRFDHDTGGWAQLVIAPVAPGTNDLVARFEEPRWLELRVRGDEGLPVTQFRAAIVDAEPHVAGIDLGPLDSSEEWEPHAGGTARLLVPAVPFRVEIEAPGFALAARGPFAPAQAPAVLELDLVRRPGVCGVVDFGALEHGTISVELLRYDGHGPQGRWKSGHRTLYGGQPVSKGLITPSGLFCIDARDPGSYIVRARVFAGAEHDHPFAEFGPFELDPLRGFRDVELRIGAGGALEVRVIVGPGESAAGRIVALNHGDGEPRTVRTGADGSVRVEHLTPGNWQVRAADVELTPGHATWNSGPVDASADPARLWDCEVVEGRTTRFDLDLRAQASGVVEGVLSLEGSSAEAWLVTLRRIESEAPAAPEIDEQVTHAARLDATGRFRVEFPRAGAHELGFTAPGDPARALRLRARVSLTPGANAWSGRVALTAVAGEGLKAGDEGPPEVLYVGDGGLEAQCHVVADGAGQFAVPAVLVGRGRLIRFRKSTATEPPRWDTVLEFEAAAGGTTRLRVP